MKKILLILTVFLAANIIYSQVSSIPSTGGAASGLDDPGGNGVVVRTSSGVTTARTITGTSNEVTVSNGSGVSGNPTLSLATALNLASKTLLPPGSNTLPATCTVGEVYFDWNATAGQNWYGCTATDTWTLQGDGGGGATAVTSLTDCKVTVASVTATIAACRYEYTASDGRNVTVAISSATWAISGGTDTGTARFEIDPNGGSPIIRCIYSSGMTATNYTATGCTETSGEDFSVGTKPLAILAVATGAWTTLTDVRSMLATHTVTAGTGLNKSGNVMSLGTFTLKTKIALPLTACAGTAGTLMWDTNATLAPTATCSAGTTETAMMRGVADWPDSDGDYSVQVAFLMPDDWDTSAALDAIILWRTAATSGDAVFQIQTACRADAEVDDVAWNTASTVTDTAKGTTLQLNSAAITGITKTGCAAGELLHIRLLRNRTHASDSLAAALSIGHVELTARRSITQ